MEQHHSRFLILNGAPLTAVNSAVPSVSSFLQSTPGAYTTTRTAAAASLLLFYRRHLLRLHRSLHILKRRAPALKLAPDLDFETLASSVNSSLAVGLRLASDERRRAGSAAELAVTALVGSRDGADPDVWVHVGFYDVPVFGEGGARLAVAGRGRGKEVAEAKYSFWAWQRQWMEKMRPPGVTELLLSEDGDRILEGCLTNFFAVCRKDEPEDLYEVQTAPVSDGVLPGIIRQLVIEACASIGIPVRQVAPSWADCDLWEEAFITSSLRLIQHVEAIQVPFPYEKLHQKTWQDVSWAVKRFEGVGVITTQIQKEIILRTGRDSYQLSKFTEDRNI